MYTYTYACTLCLYIPKHTCVHTHGERKFTAKRTEGELSLITNTGRKVSSTESETTPQYKKQILSEHKVPKECFPSYCLLKIKIKLSLYTSN